MPNTIYAELKQYKPIPENYKIELLGDKPSFAAGHIAWSVYTRNEDDPARIQLKRILMSITVLLKLSMILPALWISLCSMNWY